MAGVRVHENRDPTCPRPRLPLTSAGDASHTRATVTPRMSREFGETTQYAPNASAPAPDQPRRSKGGHVMMKKTGPKIQVDVLNELRWDLRVKETSIGVPCTTVIVTPEGTVDSWYERCTVGNDGARAGY